MINKEIKKIHIIGTLGSGKSYLAKELSKELDIPYYELDDIFWEKRPVKRNEEEVRILIDRIISGDKWIIEGVYAKFLEQSVGKADLVIWLKTNPNLVTIRLFYREVILQLLKFKKPGKFFHLAKCARDYYKDDNFHKEHVEVLTKYNIDYYLIKNSKDKKRLYEDLKKVE